MTKSLNKVIIITESTDDGRFPRIWLRNNRLQFGRWAVISFYLSRRLSKYSARAISKDKIISNSTNVMYKVTTSPRFYSKGEKRNFRSPRKKGSNRHRMVHSGYVSTEIIIHEPSKYVKTKLLLYSKRKKELQALRVDYNCPIKQFTAKGNSAMPVGKYLWKTVCHFCRHASKFLSPGNGAVAEESKLFIYLSSSKD